MSSRSIRAREAITLKKKRPEAVVVSIGEADQTNAALVQASGEIQEVLHAAAKTAQLPHDEGVALPEPIQHLGETGAAGLGAAHRVFENAIASRTLQAANCRSRFWSRVDTLA